MSALGQLIVTDAAPSSANRRRNSRNDGTFADRDILVHYDSFTNPTEMNPRSSLVEESPKEEEEAAPALEPKGHLETLRLKIEEICESTTSIYLMSLLTLWTLYQGDIRLAATSKEADFPFEVIISVCFFLFSIEIILQCFYKEGYLALPIWQDAEPGESFLSRWEKRLSIGSFYFWMDVIATFTLIFDMYWMTDSKTEEAFNGNDQASVGNAARIGARVGRILRVARIVRFTRIGRLYRYATLSFYALQHEILHRISGTTNRQLAEEEKLKLDNVEESKVGLIMADLTNRRVICLIILMLLIIPLLNPTDDNISLNLAIRLVHQMAVLNASDPATYESGLLLAINVTLTQLPVIALGFNDDIPYYFDNEKMANLRDEERSDYFMSTNGTSTYISYDQQENSIEAALMSIATTSVVLVMLLGGIYAFSTDVQSLVIIPIEKLVALVKKIAQNPLGVEYKMLGAEDGFQEGMETTVLLTTINKIGGLMRVGFGEAGAAIIAKNLQESTNGKLNLLGSGTLIYSIFGFCDVRQFTDTTECLQEEVMLFVNRIAHILHSIVVQCSGAANKNIGDAFLLTWKIDEKATKEQKALLADQALLTFCKALIELARHQEFICNFSVAATGRLFKRFPDYKVRIGSGLHVGWAIEGAIGSNRKIDASYISPHVSTTEFLESSTKEYGVSLLLSEPFYRLLSPAASRFVRQVDRIRRSQDEGPMGLYTYDCDLSIDWNDPFRHRKKSLAASNSGTEQNQGQARNRWRRASALLTNPGGLQAALGLSTIQEVKSQSSASRFGGGGPGSSSNSHSQSQSQTTQSRNNSNGMLPFGFGAGRSRIGSVASEENKRAGFGRAASRSSVHAGGRRPSQLLQPLNLASLTGNYAAVPFNEEDEENPEAAEAAAADRLKKAKMTPTITVPPYTQQIWVEDQDLIDLRHKISDAFRDSWAEAMDAFIIGDWSKAREKFSETLRMSGKKDGPSKHLLAYMDEVGEGGSSPDGWSGFRDLSSEGGGH